MVSVVTVRDLDAFEIGRGAFVQAVERCDKAHAWQHALSLHQLMLEEGYGYSLSGFHALLMKEQASASRKCSWQSAVHSLELMNLYDIVPSSITISLLISCCRRGTEWRWPLNFMMSQLETKKNELTDSHSMGSAIGTCLDARQWLSATRLLDLWSKSHQADQKNLEMNEMSIFNLAITICKVARQWYKALELCKASKEVTNDIAVAATMKALGRRWQMCLGHGQEIDRRN